MHILIVFYESSYKKHLINTGLVHSNVHPNSWGTAFDCRSICCKLKPEHTDIEVRVRLANSCYRLYDRSIKKLVGRKVIVTY